MSEEISEEELTNIGCMLVDSDSCSGCIFDGYNNIKMCRAVKCSDDSVIVADSTTKEYALSYVQARLNIKDAHE